MTFWIIMLTKSFTQSCDKYNNMKWNICISKLFYLIAIYLQYFQLSKVFYLAEMLWYFENNALKVSKVFKVFWLDGISLWYQQVNRTTNQVTLDSLDIAVKVCILQWQNYIKIDFSSIHKTLDNLFTGVANVSVHLWSIWQQLLIQVVISYLWLQ